MASFRSACLAALLGVGGFLIGCAASPSSPEERGQAAQALLEKGHHQAAQTNIAAAIKAYDKVGRTYPDQDWHVLMAWKSAADLLWETGRAEEARAFDRRIVDRFDLPGAQQVVSTIVRASKNRLATP